MCMRVLPQEGELDNLGPVDDGTESLGDAPSLSEDAAGRAVVYYIHVSLCAAYFNMFALKLMGCS